MRKISNSEANTWLHCRRKYFYGYIADLEPRQTSGPLSQGNMLHALLEEYYIAKMDDLEPEERLGAVMQRANHMGADPSIDMLMLMKCTELIRGYIAKWEDEDDERYEVLAVETKFSIPVLEDVFSMAGTIDLVLRDLSNGNIVPVDHKSSYNFWTDDQCAISGQFLKYVYALRAQGFTVDRFMVNQLRTRELKPGNELFRRTWIRPTDTRIKTAIAQHVAVGSEIVEYRKNPVFEAAIPILDKYGCGSCEFMQLCDADSEGMSTKSIIATEYQPRVSYGYNNEVPE